MVLEVNVGTYLLLFALIGGQMAVLLWAAGAVIGLRPGSARLGAGAVGGALYAILADLAGFGLLPLGCLRTWYGVFGAFLATHALVYWPLPAGRLLSSLGAYSLLAMLGAGAAYVPYNLGARGWVPPLVATGVTLAAAELGWGVVQRWLWDRVVYLPLEVELLDRQVRATALLDTGNRLTDPLTGHPVVILGSDLREELLPPEAAEAVAVAAENPAAGVSLLAGTPFASRVRLVPYSTLGREQGLLLCLRADTVRIAGKEGPATETALIAFHSQPLDRAGYYQALAHPVLLQAVLAQASRRRGRLVLGPRFGVGGTLQGLGG
ncbi:MAG: sigma-E processing peptidase SpoIIGA [Betaproteobacteria bacterium]